MYNGNLLSIDVRITTEMDDGSRTTETKYYTNVHDALYKAVESMESLRRSAELSDLTHVVGYYVEVEEWIQADNYQMLLKGGYHI